jgi:hypothetical protein
MHDRRSFRTTVLVSLGANSGQIEELLRYNELSFNPASTDALLCLPPDEPFVHAWEEYAREVQTAASISVLSKYLVQLRFPVLRGMSQNVDYVAATRRGINPEDMKAASGLGLRSPEQCQLVLRQTKAGRIPLIIAGARQDFVLLIQALAKRNEPVSIPDSLGASIISGYNNWDRIHKLRAAFETSNSAQTSWEEEFEKIRANKDLYQDRFIILSTGSYSGVSASDLGLRDEQWQKLSLAIRTEHECAHYFTRRIFGSMRNNLIDEIIADFWAITSVLGAFKVDWFLRFFGVERDSNYREGSRLQNYRGDPPLTDGSFLILQQLVRRAARNLERFDRNCALALPSVDAQPALFVALTSLTVEEIASEDGAALLSEAFLRASEHRANLNFLASSTKRILA